MAHIQNTPKTIVMAAAAETDDAVTSEEVIGDDVATEDDTNAPVGKKQLVDLVVEATGKKKRDVKPIVEATLALLGEKLAGGEKLNLPPLGRLAVNNMKDHEKTQVLVTRIRRSKAMLEKTEQPLAEAGE